MIEIERPKIEIAEILENGTYGKFVIEPLEPRCGPTPRDPPQRTARPHPIRQRPVEVVLRVARHAPGLSGRRGLEGLDRAAEAVNRGLWRQSSWIKHDRGIDMPHYRYIVRR